MPTENGVYRPESKATGNVLATPKSHEHKQSFGMLYAGVTLAPQYMKAGGQGQPRSKAYMWGLGMRQGMVLSYTHL